VISVFCRGNEAVGFWLSIVNGFFLGFFSNVVQLSFFAMINYFGKKTVSRFTVGTALSGLALIILRAIITAIFGTVNSENIVPIVVYLSISVLFNLFDMYLNISLFQTEEFAIKIEKPL
jgi:hypothetical protein